MPTFFVEVREVHISHRKVEADDRDQAVAKCNEGEGEEVYLEYSDTKDKSTWSVHEDTFPYTDYYFNPATGKHDKKIG